MKSKLFILAGIFVAFAAAVLLWTYTRAEGGEIMACARKDGLLRLIGNGFKRSDCTKNEELVTWNVQGLKGEKGDTGNNGERGDRGVPGQNLRVYDANNKLVGIFLGGGSGWSSSPVGVYDTNFDTEATYDMTHVRPANARFYNPNEFAIGFEGDNCSGQRFLKRVASPYVLIYMDGRNEKKYNFVGDKNIGMVRNKQIKSFLDENENCDDTDTVFATSTAVHFVDVDYVPPLKIILE